MKLTISVALQSEEFQEFEVAPTSTLDVLKNCLVTMLPDDQAGRPWTFYHRQQPLPENDRQTLQQAGLGDGDLVQAAPTPQQSPEEIERERLEQIRHHILTNSQARADLLRHNPQMANLLNDPTQFRLAWRAMLERSNAATAAEDAMLNDDVSEENQKKILERIRQARIKQDLEEIMENNPELLGRVTMLYVRIYVNGHPVKAFVDSGAQATIISPSCAEACQIMHLIDERWSGIARGVGTARILGRIHKAPFKLSLDNDDEPCSFTVMEGKDVDMLLGLDMLKRFRGRIDLETNQLTLGGQSVSFLGEAEIPKHGDEEPVVEGPNGTSIGASTGALKPAGSSAGEGASSTASTSTAGSRAQTPASGFSGQGRTLGSNSTTPAPTPSQQRAPQPPRPSQPAAQRSAAPPGRATPTFPESSISTLQNSCGVTREQAATALMQCGGNVDMAATLLLGFGED